MLFCGLGAVLGAIALVLAPGAEREILASGGQLGGLGIIRTARICAWISVALALIGIAAAIGGWFWFLHWADHRHAT
jgi:hypothetical protein